MRRNVLNVFVCGCVVCGSVCVVYMWVGLFLDVRVCGCECVCGGVIRGCDSLCVGVCVIVCVWGVRVCVCVCVYLCALWVYVW